MTQTWERAPKMGVWFLYEIELERSDDLLLTKSWKELQMILLCNTVRKEICWVGCAYGWAQGERVNSHELGASLWDIDEDDVLDSSEQRVEMMKSRWFSCVMQWERRFVELDVSVAKHKVNMWIPVSWVHRYETEMKTMYYRPLRRELQWWTPNDSPM